jgi:hypothetical protein
MLLLLLGINTHSTTIIILILMKKITILLFALLVLSKINVLKAESLSPQAEFSLITVTPGDDLYSCFGHSAFLLLDSTNEIAKMYNYGTFDFEDPDFYLNFTRGKLKYRLSVENPGELLYMASVENRAVIQQVLQLSAGQKQRLYNFLEKNYLPENRFYQYDFFYDNCSSRLRDALVEACGDSLQFNLKFTNEGQSFRALIDPYLKNKRYQDMGMDIGLGLPADKIATPYQYMFLPDYLMEAFAGATNIVDGEKVPLIYSEQTVLPNQPSDASTPFFLQPWFAFTLLLLVVIALTYSQYKKQRNGYWLDAILFTVVGLFGLVLVFLWFFTDHGVTAKNFNLIWAMPLHLIFIPMLLRGKKIKRVSSYFLAYFFALLFLLIFWKFTPQELNANIIPLLLALAIRAMYIYYRIDKDFVRWKV